MCRLVLLMLPLILVSCGKKKTCEQTYVAHSRIENRTSRDLSLEFGGSQNEKKIPITFDLKRGTLESYQIGSGTFTNESTYSKGSFKPEDPVCTETPYPFAHMMPSLTATSFGQVKVCWPRYGGPDAIILELNDTCPADSWEQTKPATLDAN